MRLLNQFKLYLSDQKWYDYMVLENETRQRIKAIEDGNLPDVESQVEYLLRMAGISDLFDLDLFVNRSNKGNIRKWSPNQVGIAYEFTVSGLLAIIETTREEARELKGYNIGMEKFEVRQDFVRASNFLSGLRETIMYFESKRRGIEG